MFINNNEKSCDGYKVISWTIKEGWGVHAPAEELPSLPPVEAIRERLLIPAALKEDIRNFERPNKNPVAVAQVKA